VLAIKYKLGWTLFAADMKLGTSADGWTDGAASSALTTCTSQYKETYLQADSGTKTIKKTFTSLPGHFKI
jgi:hypothetical protein